jgi:hypothetical protein
MSDLRAMVCMRDDLSIPRKDAIIIISELEDVIVSALKVPLKQYHRSTDFATADYDRMLESGYK